VAGSNESESAESPFWWSLCEPFYSVFAHAYRSHIFCCPQSLPVWYVVQSFMYTVHDVSIVYSLGYFL